MPRFSVSSLPARSRILGAVVAISLSLTAIGGAQAPQKILDLNTTPRGLSSSPSASGTPSSRSKSRRRDMRRARTASQKKNANTAAMMIVGPNIEPSVRAVT